MIKQNKKKNTPQSYFHNILQYQFFVCLKFNCNKPYQYHGLDPEVVLLITITAMCWTGQVLQAFERVTKGRSLLAPSSVVTPVSVREERRSECHWAAAATLASVLCKLHTSQRLRRRDPAALFFFFFFF